ncbi:hypothetical protein AB0L40_06065 [Patulibacter sp. NPDC049589]|uniref:hypothetical protein n=1 Tax=Patulibacter sp. NPDC049589 TaxID=3154731 RepID=UPI00342942EF
MRVLLQPRRRRVVVAMAAGLLTVLVPSVASGAPRARGFEIPAPTGWHVADEPQQVAGRVTVSDGRVWIARVKGKRESVATGGGILEVISRRLTGGGERRWQQKLPVDGDPSVLADVVVDAIAESKGRLYVEVFRCAPPHETDSPDLDPGTPCEGTGPRMFTFDAATGAPLAATPPDGTHRVVPVQGGGTLLNLLPPFDPTATDRIGTLTDPLTGQALPGPSRASLRLPPTAAGPFYTTWPMSGDTTDFAVVDTRSGAIDHRVSVASYYAKTGVRWAPDSDMEVLSTLQPDGSIALAAQPVELPLFHRGLYAAFVDRSGHARRIGGKFRAAYRVSAIAAASRAIVASEGGTVRRKGRTVRPCSGVWLSTLSGSRGAEISGTGKLEVSGAPYYWDGTTGVWERRRGKGRYDIVVRRLSGTTLHRADRPRCTTR